MGNFKWGIRPEYRRCTAPLDLLVSYANALKDGGTTCLSVFFGSASWRETIAGLLCSLIWMMMLLGILGLFQILAEVKFPIENG